MARKDDILCSFLRHEMLTSKYEINSKDIPLTVREGLNSSIPIIKAISLIVDGLENPIPITESSLRNQILQFLNEAI